MSDFMKGRYGVDELTTTLGLLGMLLALIGSFSGWRPLSWVALAVVLLAIVRALSKNGAARRGENRKFMDFAAQVPGLNKLVAGMGGMGASQRSGSEAARPRASKSDFDRAKRTAKKMWSERKTSRFLKCPSCGQMLSIPKGKGRIRVTCPKCHAKMETKS